MKQIIYIILILSTLLSSCDNNLRDGRYCAEITYYYPKTGTHSTYILEVEVQENKLTTIYWSNGGWLDETHFTAPELIDKQASFVSDRGVEYDVRILDNKQDCSSPNSKTSLSENDFIVQENAHFCPQCGRGKDIRASYCNTCQIEMEYVYVYGSVDFLTYRVDGKYLLELVNGFKTIDKEGLACTRIFRIRRSKISDFKQRFFSSTDVQYSSSDSYNSTYITYPKTVDVNVFKTMEEATESLMKNSDRSLTMFHYSELF